MHTQVKDPTPSAHRGSIGGVWWPEGAPIYLIAVEVLEGLQLLFGVLAKRIVEHVHVHLVYLPTVQPNRRGSEGAPLKDII